MILDSVAKQFSYAKEITDGESWLLRNIVQSRRQSPFLKAMISLCEELFVIFIMSRVAVCADIWGNKSPLGETDTNFIHHFPPARGRLGLTMP
jgi:hypothetical protein